MIGGAGKPCQAEDHQSRVRQLELGNINLDEEYVIMLMPCVRAGASHGSTIYAARNSERVKVEDLVRADDPPAKPNSIPRCGCLRSPLLLGYM
jgi:hypothetical protein